MSDAMGRSVDKGILIELTTEIVSAYVGKNTVRSEELPNLIREVHGSLADLGGGGSARQPLKPAVDVENSIAEDYLICLEDGKKFKSLKRHLRTKYDMTPDEYREKWGLPADYPMVAPGYSRERSRLAKEMGLGKG